MIIPSLNSASAVSDLAPRRPTTEGAAPASATSDSSPARPANITEQAVQAAKEVQPSRNELDKAVKAVNEFVGAVNNDLRFSVDEDSGKTVVKVIDVTTKEVIKQYPSEEMLAIAKALDSIKGLLVQQKA
jgi:flagellar protein FlaG